MAAATKQFGQDLLSPDELMDGLEEIRAGYPGGVRPERGRKAKTIEEIAATKRRSHKGGDGNHRFEGERYLNSHDNREAPSFGDWIERVFTATLEEPDGPYYWINTP